MAEGGVRRSGATWPAVALLACAALCAGIGVGGWWESTRCDVQCSYGSAFYQLTSAEAGADGPRWLVGGGAGAAVFGLTALVIARRRPRDATA